MSSWTEKLFGGFRRTSDKLGENLSGLFGKAALDEETLDQIEEALIASDLGPTTAKRVRERLTGERFALGLTEAKLREVVAEEIGEILAPVKTPNEVVEGGATYRGDVVFDVSPAIRQVVLKATLRGTARDLPLTLK